MATNVDGLQVIRDLRRVLMPQVFIDDCLRMSTICCQAIKSYPDHVADIDSTSSGMHIVHELNETAVAYIQYILRLAAHYTLSISWDSLFDHIA